MLSQAQRKKMGTRKHQAKRCSRCFMVEQICLCGEIESIENQLHLKTRIEVIMHHREWKATTNTSRLLNLISDQCQIHLRGEEDSSLNTSCLISDTSRHHIFLFPSDEAIPLSNGNLSSVFKESKPYTLIVPDGSWRQAQKVYKRESSLSALPIFKLGAEIPSSQYFLRKEPRGDGMATFEAMAYALGVLENMETQNILLDFFKIFVKKTLDSRQGIFSTNSILET